jgi:pimeloyl-ACP methyl ester carboxylesterase
METLVLVHGFFGGSAQWVDQKAFFSEHFRVLTPDLAGFGANNHLQAPDRIEGFAEFVLQYVIDQGVDRFQLLGHSLGGFIAQEMVSKASKRINKLVLYGTGPAGLMPGLCLQQPECAVISDTVAIANEGLLKDHMGTLTGYGWAARFLQYYVRDRGVLSLTEGLRKITAIPAERLGLQNRGKLKPGYHADICVFDQMNIASNVTAKQPRRYASGIAHVLVNGQFSMQNGERKMINAGQVLRDFSA